MFGWLIEFMQSFLIFLNDLVNNYGLAIIVFTLIVRFLLYPLTSKQTRSMKKMQDLQPEMEKIKEKYEDDKQEQQKKMMELYKENNVNPLAGCFPMILQLAILIPLYRAILDLEIGGGFLWMASLTEPDVALVIINAVAMVGQTYVTSKISGQNKQANKMMYFMPLFILVIGFQLPAGILVYWVTSTIFTVLQQYRLSQEPGSKEVVNNE